jgi:hypothetical protein
MLNVVTLNVIMHSVNVLNVVAPFNASENQYKQYLLPLAKGFSQKKNLFNILQEK